MCRQFLIVPPIQTIASAPTSPKRDRLFFLFFEQVKEEAKADSDVRQKAPANTCFGKASHQLAALIAKTAKLASKGKLDPTCQAAIEARATRPLAIVTALAGGQ